MCHTQYNKNCINNKIKNILKTIEKYINIHYMIDTFNKK